MRSRTPMNSADPTPFEPKSVSHPGETVLDYLEFHGWSQRDLARRTGITPKTISEICNGKAPITPTTALTFENVFGRPARLWLNLQRCFDEELLRSSLEALRRLTRERANMIMDPLQSICAKAGAAVVLVPELPQTSISGCAKWLSDKRALVGLTLRYKTDDQLWYTFFHE